MAEEKRDWRSGREDSLQIQIQALVFTASALVFAGCLRQVLSLHWDSGGLASTDRPELFDRYYHNCIYDCRRDVYASTVLKLGLLTPALERHTTGPQREAL